MKRLTIMLSLLLAVSASGEPRTATTTYRTTNKFYLIEFRYDDSSFMRPLTIPAGVPHYDAEISVYRVTDGRPKPVCKSWRGNYTGGTCYEDDPAELVARALREAGLDLPHMDMTNTAVASEPIVLDLLHMVGTAVAMKYEPITNTITLTPYNLLDCSTNSSSVVLASAKNIHLSVDGTIAKLNEQGDLTNLIKRLVEAGDVCAVVGHKWQVGCGKPGCLVLHRDNHRFCLVCGKVETQTVSEWR